ncbi:MAG: MATE family efflux transporter [Oscillospiraceae bacterium]|nr:MATE family efflux transporter [Oscillospiraceae bacterium]
MASHVKQMTEGNPLSLIVSFSLPLMAGNIFQQMYTVVDTMVVGKVLGVDALAALGATDWLHWLVLGMIQGVTQGFGILMARKYGAQQYESLRKITGNSAVLSCLCAVLFLLISQAAARPVLLLLQTPETILPMSMTYLRIMFMGIPIVFGYNLLACILRSLGDGQTPLNAMIIASVLNIGLDLLFVLGFGWGIVGAAAATLIAQLFSGIFCFVRLRCIEFLTLKTSDFHLEKGLSLQLMNLGWPIAAQNAIIAVGGMIIQTVVNGCGVIFIAGFTATNKLYGILEMAATSYGYAMITYVGQNLGACRYDRIRKGMRCAVAVSIVTSGVITTVMITLGRSIVGLFLSGSAQEVAQATEIAYQYLVVMSVCLPVLYILHVTRSAVQGMGNTVLPMISGVAEFFMRTGGVLLLPALLGQTGIFIAEVMAWMGADLILIPSYFITFRQISRK